MIRIVLILMVFPLFALGASVDNFSAFNSKRQDYTHATNLAINMYLARIAKQSKSCDIADNMKIVKIVLNTNFPDINKDVVHLHLFDVKSLGEAERVLKTLKKRLSAEKSAMRKATAKMAKGALLKKMARVAQRLATLKESVENQSPLFTKKSGFKPPGYRACCSPVVSINGVMAGIDKVDHFLSSGYHYYVRSEFKESREPYDEGLIREIFERRTDPEHKKLEVALNLGKFQEESTWGLSGSGVKSYGDLASNYQGLLFYRELFDGDNPYLACKKGRLVVNRKFYISDYIDDAWDESINCSSYNSKANRDAVFRAVGEIGKGTCPLSREKCQILTKKYGEVARHILHPKCLDPNSNHSQIEMAKPNFFKTMQFIEFRDFGRAMKGAK